MKSSSAVLGASAGQVTVLIPTASRPETLELTLRSVGTQTALAEIERVIVSENLGDRRSEAVCDLFPELPIDYVVQDPQLTVPSHVAWLLKQPNTEFGAFVCDDDLWSPGHVATGLDSLRRDPGAAAFFSAFVGAESELAQSGFSWGAGLLWLAANRPPRVAEYRYELPQVTALSWVFTPFQFSTLIARSSAMRAAAPAVADSSHSFYADRVLCMALAHEGSILFSPMVDAIYRSYEGNWQHTQDRAHLIDLLRMCHEEIEAQAKAEGADLPALWRAYLKDMPDEVAPEVKRWFSDRFTAEELREYDFSALLPSDPTQPSVPARVAGRFGRAFRELTGR